MLRRWDCADDGNAQMGAARRPFAHRPVPGCLLYYFQHPLGKRRLDELARCRARQGGAAAALPGWRKRSVPTAGCGPPAYLRTPVGCQLQLQRQRQCCQAGAPEDPRAPGARHPSSCASCSRALCMLRGAQADAAARRQSGFSVWRCFCGAVSRLAWFAQTPLYILLN